MKFTHIDVRIAGSMLAGFKNKNKNDPQLPIPQQMDLCSKCEFPSFIVTVYILKSRGWWDETRVCPAGWIRSQELPPPPPTPPPPPLNPKCH